MTYCTTHPTMPATRQCTDCRTDICRNCTFEEVVKTRITAYSMYDSVTQRDYGFFCPRCFVNYAEKIGYHKGTKGMLFDTKRTKMGDFTLIFPFWILFIFGALSNFIIFPYGFILWGLTLIPYFLMKTRVESNFRKYHDALRLINGKQSQMSQPMMQQPVMQQPAKHVSQEYQPTSITNVNPTGVFCSKCGSRDQDGTFCKSCGSKLARVSD